MAVLKRELKEILERYGINPTDKSKLWDCHGTLVLYHRAYEIIAAQEGIKFDAPVMIEADSNAKIVAMLVTGRMGERAEWSVGEAAPGNNKNSYPYAIAEKRAKDRVVAKLVGLAEYVYSEDEADEFKGDKQQVQTAPTSEQTQAPPPDPERTKKVESAREAKDRIKAALENAPTPTQIERIINVNSKDLAFIKDIHAPAYEALMLLANTRRVDLVAAA